MPCTEPVSRKRPGCPSSSTARDSCPEVADPGQRDLDRDGLGDACDVDDDGDGVADAADGCPEDADPEQQDTDGDGAGDACDVDDDGDGLVDDDGDGLVDDDGDGLEDADEARDGPAAGGH
ncbi:MAG: hypothetical protein FJ125_00800 [Deltaproteobacteria bacterium]|nr:hypothetical protein [Deltaproteobacteria bacterium]